jgi:leucyl/phenylalanyl-tRNA--protein transferase
VDVVTFVDPTKYKSSLDFDQIDWSTVSEFQQGIVALGGRLTVGTLFQAYRHGVFPWPHENHPLLWFSPDPRGVLFFKDFHWSTKIKKKWKTWFPQFRISYNEAFSLVIDECQKQKRKGQDGTWINEDMKKAYLKFHKEGFAHSVEVWREDKLVGGMYGVLVQGVFSGESLFHKEDDTSKLALWAGVQKLKSLGLTWMDTQMVTPLLASMGGQEVSREKYFKMLQSAQKSNHSA